MEDQAEFPDSRLRTANLGDQREDESTTHYRAPNSRTRTGAMRTEVLNDDIDAMAIAASVIESHVEATEVGVAVPAAAREASPEQTDRATALLAVAEDVTAVTGWPLAQLGALLGCAYPNPETWLDVDITYLDQSVAVVQLIGEHAALCAKRDSSHAIAFVRRSQEYKANPDELDAELLASRAVVRLLERRAAAREGVYLAIEILSRVRGDVNNARDLLGLQVGGSLSTAGLVSSDELGAAREVALLRRRSAAVAGRLVLSSRAELIEAHGDLVDQWYGELDAANSAGHRADDVSPDEIRKRVAQQLRSMAR